MANCNVFMAILLIVIIVIVIVIFMPIDTRYSPLDLVANPSELTGNVINKFEWTRDFNKRASLVSCLADNKLCAYIRPPFVTECGKSCEESFGPGWVTQSETTDHCALYPRTTRKICKKI